MLCQCTSTCQRTSPNHSFMLSFGTFLPNVSVSHVQPEPISFITECKYWCSVVCNKLLLSTFLCESCLPKETMPVPLLTLSLCLWMSRFSPGCLPLTPTFPSFHCPAPVMHRRFLEVQEMLGFDTLSLIFALFRHSQEE